MPPTKRCCDRSCHYKSQDHQTYVFNLIQHVPALKVEVWDTYGLGGIFQGVQDEQKDDSQ